MPAELSFLGGVELGIFRYSGSTGISMPYTPHNGQNKGKGVKELFLFKLISGRLLIRKDLVVQNKLSLLLKIILYNT
jgi:hypothetical protein